MATYKQAGIIVGGAAGGEIIHELGVYADKKRVTDKWYKEISTWVDLVGGATLIALPFLTDLDKTWEDLLFATGGFLVATKGGEMLANKVLHVRSAPVMARPRAPVGVRQRAMPVMGKQTFVPQRAQFEVIGR